MEILKEVLKNIKPSEKELARMKLCTKKFVEALEEKIKKSKIKADVFVGGSSGKGTVVRREKFDIDIFVRFVEDKDISRRLEKSLSGFKKKKIHGSRDYFKVKFSGLGFEVVPVLKISKPEEAKNVTDLSYFHVSYVRNKIRKKKKLADEIMLAKSFCYAQDCYGAESYIKGFSGYALELLVINYGSFERMISVLCKAKPKIIIDAEKLYKGKRIEEEMNEAKLASPIILIDPTYKERNVMSALSYETFYKFQEACKKFLRKPSKKFFDKPEVNPKDYNLILEARTNKQEGDIAGSKLLKFYNYLSKELEKYFFVEKKEFDYEGKKQANLYFKVKKRKEIIFEGPPINAIENAVKFKKKHKNAFIKNGKVYAKEKVSITTRSFILKFKKENKKRMRDMGITCLG